MVECSRVMLSQVESSRTMVECSISTVECGRDKYSQVEQRYSVLESSRAKESHGRV